MKASKIKAKQVENVAIQLFNGVDKKLFQKKGLKKQRGRMRRAYFRINNPDAFLSDNFKEIQGMYLNTKNGELLLDY